LVSKTAIVSSRPVTYNAALLRQHTCTARRSTLAHLAPVANECGVQGAMQGHSSIEYSFASQLHGRTAALLQPFRLQRVSCYAEPGIDATWAGTCMNGVFNGGLQHCCSLSDCRGFPATPSLALMQHGLEHA